MTMAAILPLSTADAVQLSNDGRGEVLLYPYYTTRSDSAGNAYATLMSVVNATASAKSLRVRFLEGKNGRDVLDFNLFLSPFDVWTAAVLPDTASGGAKIGTFDLSCTLPPLSTSPIAPFAAFFNYVYTGVSDDGAGTDLDRTREGYFEIIEMATYASSSVTGKAVTHVNGVAPCGGALSDVQAAQDAMPPGGGLFGAVTFINVNSGTDYSADAVALADFHQSGSNYQPIGTLLPDLTQASPPISTVLAPDGRLYESLWSAGTADAVSAVLMHNTLINEYVLDTATKSGTDWVVTLPTKRHYVATGTGNAPRLFQRNFNGTAGSCDSLGLSSYDREERASPVPSGGPVPPQPIRELCASSTVITFVAGRAAPVESSNVFGSLNVLGMPTDIDFFAGQKPPPENGWLHLTMPTLISGAHPNVHRLINEAATSISGKGQMTTGNTVTYVGLPVIGFAATSFSNGTLVVGGQNVLSNYGGSFVHKSSTLIQ
jgi:hypothetical protein